MDRINKKNMARRQLIQFLAASPIFAGLSPGRLLAGTLLNPVSSPEDALDVFDFQRVAEQVLPPAHYGYLVTSMKVVIKGIVTPEDANNAVQHGADALIVSNHGGRAEASGWATLDSLPGVVNAVNAAIPVMVDSGFRRGTDIFKALALGADAVCIGRAYIWGLAAFGQPGVEKVLEILRAELAMVMGQMGTPALKDIGPNSIGRF